MLSENYYRSLEKSLHDKSHLISRLKSKTFYLELIALMGWGLFLISQLQKVL